MWNQYNNGSPGGAWGGYDYGGGGYNYGQSGGYGGGGYGGGWQQRGGGRGGRGRGRGRGRGSKRNAAAGGGGGAAKKQASHAPGLSVSNIILLSGEPSDTATHEVLSSTQFSNINNTLKVGRFDYSMTVSSVTSDSSTTSGNKVEFEVQKDDLAYCHLIEVEEEVKQAVPVDDAANADVKMDDTPAATDTPPAADTVKMEDTPAAAANGAEEEPAVDGEQPGAAETPKDKKVPWRERTPKAKKKEPVTGRLVVVLKNPVKITREGDRIIPADKLLEARVLIFEFRSVRAKIAYEPKAILRKILAEGPLVGYDNFPVWPESGPQSMNEVVTRFVESVGKEIIHGMELLPCPLGCGQHKPRRNMEKHTEFDCSKRESKCTHCEESIEVGDLPKHHSDDCQVFPAKCEFGCGQIVLRKDRDQHRTCEGECPRKPTQCRYSTYGCDVSWVPEAHLKHHYKEHTATHLGLVEDRLSQVEQRMDNLEKQQQA